MGSCSWRQEGEDPLGGNTQRKITLREFVFGLEEEEEVINSWRIEKQPKKMKKSKN